MVLRNFSVKNIMLSKLVLKIQKRILVLKIQKRILVLKILCYKN